MGAQWFEDHDNLVTLTRWLADSGYSARNIADVIEKPWKYDDEFAMAHTVNTHEHANNHTVYKNDDFDVYCNDCEWTAKLEDARQEYGWCRCGAKDRLIDDGSRRGPICFDCMEDAHEDARQQAAVARAEAGAGR